MLCFVERSGALASRITPIWKSAGPGRAPPQFQPVSGPDCDGVDGDAAADDVLYKVGKIIGCKVNKTSIEIY
jgi:hypothetical protein